MGQLSAVEDTEGTGTTIVGAQPPRRQRSKVQVSAGVERILFLAATDSAFHRLLLQDREAAVKASRVELTASELLMLRAAPAAQLEATIAALNVTPENLDRRRFMKAVAISAAAVAAAETLGGCGDDDKGATADSSPNPKPDSGPPRDGEPPDSLPRDGEPPDLRVDTFGGSVDAGVLSDMPFYFDSGGIRPGDGE
jgi:hypothetical protein